jgi:hypothetical protein
MAEQTLTILNQDELVSKQAQLYCNKLNQLAFDKGQERDFIIMQGTKFLKVTRNETEAFAFIDKKTGEVYKPKSWRKAAKGVRYNLLEKESIDKLFSNLDLYGEHLYQYAVNFINKKQ